jgi:hypothetical protein
LFVAAVVVVVVVFVGFVGFVVVVAAVGFVIVVFVGFVVGFVVVAVAVGFVGFVVVVFVGFVVVFYLCLSYGQIWIVRKEGSERTCGLPRGIPAVQEDAAAESGTDARPHRFSSSLIGSPS